MGKMLVVRTWKRKTWAGTFHKSKRVWKPVMRVWKSGTKELASGERAKEGDVGKN